MMEMVDVRTFNTDKDAFFKKHLENGDCKIYTSNFENNGYSKTYAFEDGAVFVESSRYVWEDGLVKAKGVTFTQTVKLFKTEYWSTESETKCFYERA